MARRVKGSICRHWRRHWRAVGVVVCAGRAGVWPSVHIQKRVFDDLTSAPGGDNNSNNRPNRVNIDRLLPVRNSVYLHLSGGPKYDEMDEAVEASLHIRPACDNSGDATGAAESVNLIES